MVIQVLGTRTDNLAQASQARLSETGRGSPRPSTRTVAQTGHPCFERVDASLRRGELA
ncbi:hypothetical protein DEO72_LG4g192 [Vigna unguiculata]|uniref:Uncharacterized protein n=1 Tax=Vigna unguiculata TaxID=3917 RepID=A0A4D6LKJ5_VIGUN|nr:hypothetical protein DEO72_LG4g192 [Vigna unguiculata]